jgi:hypothetical protein
MKRSTRDHRPLFDPWCDWKELPDDVRQQALDVLTALYLEAVDSHNSETVTDDSSHA